MENKDSQVTHATIPPRRYMAKMSVIQQLAMHTALDASRSSNKATASVSTIPVLWYRAEGFPDVRW